MPLQSYPYPHSTSSSPNGRITMIDTEYPGTSCERLIACMNRVGLLDETRDLSGSYYENIRPKLLWAAGLRNLETLTGHAFMDDNHCDICTMRSEVSQERNASGEIVGISTKNFLGDHIQKGSLHKETLVNDEGVNVDMPILLMPQLLGTGPSGQETGNDDLPSRTLNSGSWSTCTNGCHIMPKPHDVAHIQFKSRIAFKLVWLPSTAFFQFVLVDDLGRLLKRSGPIDFTQGGPPLPYRKRNYQLVKGGIYDIEGRMEVE